LRENPLKRFIASVEFLYSLHIKIAENTYPKKECNNIIPRKLLKVSYPETLLPDIMVIHEKIIPKPREQNNNILKSKDLNSLKHSAFIRFFIFTLLIKNKHISGQFINKSLHEHFGDIYF
jgi:hypothetical protein